MNDLLLGCNLKSLRNKFVITNSQVLSSKLLETHTHFGARAHSIRSLVTLLDQHSIERPSSRSRGPLSDRERELLGEKLRTQLKSSYYQKAFELPGLRAKVFECLDELRIAGYDPDRLAPHEIENSEKILALREVFRLYSDYLNAAGVTDYPVLLQSVILRIQKGSYDVLLKNTDLLMPFSLDLQGMETSLVLTLSERTQVYGLNDEGPKDLKTLSHPDSKSLERLKLSLSAHLRLEAIERPIASLPLDSSLTVQASLTPRDALSEVFHWMQAQGACAGDTAWVVLDYDRYAGPLYRFCQKHQVPLNLSRGMLASEFAFFAEDLSALSRLETQATRSGAKTRFLSDVRSYFRARVSSHPAYDSFRAQALRFVEAYEVAQAGFPDVLLGPNHAWDRLRSELRAARLSVKDLELDRHGLFLGRPEDLLGCKIPHLVILGLQDHQYPPKVVPDPILTDTERDILNEHVEEGAMVHELKRSQLRENQKDVLEKICLGVSSALYLGYESHDLQSGELSLPSSFLNRVLTAFGYEQKSESLYQLGSLPESFFPRAANAGNPFVDFDSHLSAHLEAGESFSRWKEVLTRRRDRKLNAEDGVESPRLSAKFADRDISASAIADFFTCPYRFFLKKVAGIPALPEAHGPDLAWLDPMQRGTLIHAVFEGLAQAFIDGGPMGSKWKSFLKKEATGLIEPLLKQASNEFAAQRFLLPVQIVEAELAEVRSIATTFIVRELEQVEATGFYPVLVEADFKDLAFALPSPSPRPLKFTGSVDRLDSDGQGRYRVLDYKTGKNRYRDSTNFFLDAEKYVHFQHAIYGHWAVTQSGFEVKPSMLSTGYYFTSDSGGWELVEAPYSQHESIFQASMVLFQEALESGVFHKQMEACDRCDYRLVCGGIPKRRDAVLLSPSSQLSAILAALTGPVHE